MVEQARCKRLAVNQYRAGFDSWDHSQIKFKSEWLKLTVYKVVEIVYNVKNEVFSKEEIAIHE